MLICVGWRHSWLFFICSEIDSSAFGLELTKIFWICFHSYFSAYPVWGCVNGGYVFEKCKRVYRIGWTREGCQLHLPARLLHGDHGSLMAESPSLLRAFPLRGFQIISESTTWRGQLLFLMRKVVADGYATLFSTWDPRWSNLIFWWWASWGIPNVLHLFSNQVSKGITQRCKQPSCKVQQQNVTRLSSKSILVSVRAAKDIDLYQNTGNENVLLPASLCSFPRKPANQSWLQLQFKQPALTFFLPTELSLCVCKAEIWLNNVPLGAQKKERWNRATLWLSPPIAGNKLFHHLANHLEQHWGGQRRGV